MSSLGGFRGVTVWSSDEVLRCEDAFGFSARWCGGCS